MISMRRPSNEEIGTFLTSQSSLGLTYAAVGATATTPPPGYVVDHTRSRLGQGEVIFSSARAAITRWQQLQLGWVEAWSPETPIRPGALVAVMARLFGLWWLSACQVVYVVDEQGPLVRFGFAYGTLPDHAGSGEERFLVEWDRESGEVWYDILAFSRPRWVVSRICYWYMRRLQKRFGRESVAALRKMVQE